MSVELASDTHGNLDEQISQLMQCKPLIEPEVLFLISYFVLFCILGFLWFELRIIVIITFIMDLISLLVVNGLIDYIYVSLFE